LRPWLFIAGGCWWFASLFLFCGRRGFHDLFVPATAAAETTTSKEGAVAFPSSLPRWQRSHRDRRQGRARRIKRRRYHGRRRHGRCDGCGSRADMARNGDGYAMAPTTAARSWWGVVAETFFASLFFNTATNVAAMMTPSVPPLQAPPPQQTTQTPMARASRTRAAASMAGRSAAERQWLLSRCPGWPRLLSRIGRRLE